MTDVPKPNGRDEQSKKKNLKKGADDHAHYLPEVEPQDLVTPKCSSNKYKLQKSKPNTRLQEYVY